MALRPKLRVRVYMLTSHKDEAQRWCPCLMLKTAHRATSALQCGCISVFYSGLLGDKHPGTSMPAAQLILD